MSARTERAPSLFQEYYASQVKSVIILRLVFTVLCYVFTIYLCSIKYRTLIIHTNTINLLSSIVAEQNQSERDYSVVRFRIKNMSI